MIWNVAYHIAIATPMNAPACFSSFDNECLIVDQPVDKMNNTTNQPVRSAVSAASLPMPMFYDASEGDVVMRMSDDIMIMTKMTMT